MTTIPKRQMAKSRPTTTRLPASIIYALDMLADDLRAYPEIAAEVGTLDRSKVLRACVVRGMASLRASMREQTAREEVETPKAPEPKKNLMATSKPKKK